MLEILSTYYIKLGVKGGLWNLWVESQQNDYKLHVQTYTIGNSCFKLKYVEIHVIYLTARSCIPNPVYFVGAGDGCL